MTQLCEVEFKGSRREIFQYGLELPLRTGEHVVVDADRGEDCGVVISKGMLAKLKLRDKEVSRQIKRRCSEEDLEQIKKNEQQELDAFKACKVKIQEHNLPMKLVDVELQFDHSKITFFFTAEQRIDFRALVKDLAAIHRTRIEMRQIGVRDEARRVDGYGRCGRKQCCTSHLKEFEQISTQMAKEQHLSMNPSKISGNCGRLLCCLRYELEFYQEQNKRFPAVGLKIQTPGGMGTIQEFNIFSEKITMRMDDGSIESALFSPQMMQAVQIEKEVSANSPVKEEPAADVSESTEKVSQTEKTVQFEEPPPSDQEQPEPPTLPEQNLSQSLSQTADEPMENKPIEKIKRRVLPTDQNEE